tara:strand:+ start:8487 stop:9692 length:1206 start_codon:yes stop_codon:yes gene_type:complete
MVKIPISPWPCFTEEEVDSVSKVLLSNKVNYWTGDECQNFENEFAQQVGVKYAISVANGTVALDLAMISLGIGPGDEVIVTSRTYIASATSILNVGASTVFVDVNLDTQNIDTQKILGAITKKTKAILCVHFAGWPCDMDPILDIAKKHNLFVVEDCAQAHGALYKGKSVGSIGHLNAWSFCQDKIITTGGEGGMITTNDKDLWLKAWSYKDHGKSWKKTHEKHVTKGFKWVHDTIGTNWRMTAMQAAIGRVQLRRLPNWGRVRRSNMAALHQALQNSSIFRVPMPLCQGCDGKCKPKSLCVHAAYKCYFFVKGNESLRNRAFDEFEKRGVNCFTGSCSEIYLEKAFDDIPLSLEGRLPNAKELGETSLMLQCHPTITHKEIQEMCKIIREVNDYLSDYQG